MNEDKKQLTSKEYKQLLIERAKTQYELLKQKQQTKSSDEKFVEKESILQKAKSFGQSMVSRGVSNKKANEETKALRNLSCHGSEELGLPPCADRKNSVKFENSFYCGACGCGDKKMTQLVTLVIDGKEQYSKLDFPKVNCPLKMPGFTNYHVSEEGVSENSRKKTIEDRYSIDYIKEHSS